jgi:hypothetical protein
MKWEEVRELYPNQYVLLQVLEKHLTDDKEYIDDVAIIRAIQDPKQATHELVNAKPDILVYHTANQEIVIHLLKRPGLRGVM